MNHRTRPLLGLFFSSLMGLSINANAAGFQVSEISVSGLGRAFAGAGVGGESISDMFFNPASLAQFDQRELELGLHVLSTSAEFNNTGSTQRFATPAGLLTVPAGGSNSDGGGTSLIPNFFYAAPLNENMNYGIGITSPFGLTTEYDDNWVGRYAALKSELITVEINPNLSYKLGENNAIGLGLIVMNADAELTNAQFTGVGSTDARATIGGDDVGIGFTLGITGENEHGRVGFGFRSRVRFEVDGELSIPGVLKSGASADLALPKTMYLSGLWKVKPNLDVLGSIRYTDWESFEELRFQFDSGLPDAVTPENWSASEMYSVGMNYRHNDQWTYRAGIALDNSPVSDEFRTARIPDTDRFWLSFGGSYKHSEKISFDFGYTHVFSDTVSLNETTDLVSSAPGAATSTLTGEYTDADANLFSAAIRIKIGK